eukprot:symbB.v1.2.037308.t1/scaffold5471.1/size26785/3
MTTLAPNPVPTAMFGPELLEGSTWFDSNWPFVGCFLFPIALTIPFLPFLYTRSSVKSAFDDALRSPYVLGWLTVPFYLLHQTEEHAYDLRGWRYAFVPGFNHGVGALVFKECEKLGHLRCPLEPRVTSEVNVGSIWIGFSLCMIAAQCLRGPYAYAGLCNWGMCMGQIHMESTSAENAFGGHLIPWLFLGYNPGAVQSLFQFGFGVWFLSRCPGTLRFAATAIFDGIIFHIITFGFGTNLVLKFHCPTEVVGLLGIITTTLLPLGLARLAAPKKSYEKIEEVEDDASPA